MPQWALWVQYIINGIAAGSIYALLGMGLTLIFGMLFIISFVHGEFYMLGGFVAFYLMATVAGLPYLVAVPIAMIVVGLFAAGVARLTITPLRERHWESPMLSTVGSSYVILALALIVFGGQYKNIHSPFNETVFRFGYFWLSAQKLIVIAVVVIVLIALRWMLQSTTFGRRLRATAQDKIGAATVGINSGSIYTWAFGLACSIAAAGGVLVGAIYHIDPYIGQVGLLKGWIVVILGGMGNVTGALLAGMVIGIAESLATGFIGAGWAETVALAIMIITLMIRPQGLLGEAGGASV
jgi:branched-chain amino acid transport system permease protein